jgi:hypothetical protein
MNLRPVKPESGIEKLDFVIDSDTVMKLQSMVSSFTEDDWNEWDHRQKVFDNHTHTKTIRFEWLDLGIKKYEVKDSQDFAGFENLKSILGQFFNFVESKYRGKVCRIILTRQNPKSVIPKHTDNGFSLSYTHRLHVPIFTDSSIKFGCGVDEINMQVGSAYEINNQLTHWVTNDSESAYKIHFIIDVIEERHMNREVVPQKALFVHVPKTAGTSIERTLKLNEKCGWVRDPSYLMHDPLFLLQKTNNITEDTFVFSVVRNPFTRTYSYYKHFKRNNQVELPFKDFLQIIRNRIPPTSRTPLIGYNQSFYLFGDDGLLGISKLYKYENLLELEYDFNIELGYSNIGNYSALEYLKDYGEEEKNLVRHICAEDFMNFGYSLEF